jgi:16S rRNA (guanine527-N7)-methyltransferase
MNEESIRAQLGVSRETFERLEAFVAYLIEENDRQNLVSRGTLGDVWSRHILDSAQLLRFAPDQEASWLDLGTGAGFPGLLIGLLHRGPVTLVEERKKRADFLAEAAGILGIRQRIAIHCTRAERFESPPFDVISARAFAPLGRLLEISHSFSTVKTRWILPKGRNAASELEAAKASWHGEFRLEQSLTDADARIIVAEGVSPKVPFRAGRGKRAR